MAVSKWNDLGIGGQLMDPAQLPRAASSSIRGASRQRNHPISLRHYLYPLDEGSAISS